MIEVGVFARVWMSVAAVGARVREVLAARAWSLLVAEVLAFFSCLLANSAAGASASLGWFFRGVLVAVGAVGAWVWWVPASFFFSPADSADDSVLVMVGVFLGAFVALGAGMGVVRVFPASLLGGVLDVVRVGAEEEVVRVDAGAGIAGVEAVSPNRDGPVGKFPGSAMGSFSATLDFGVTEAVPVLVAPAGPDQVSADRVGACPEFRAHWISVPHSWTSARAVSCPASASSSVE